MRCARHVRLALDQRLVDRPVRAAGQADEALAHGLEKVQAHMRFGRVRRVEIGAARKPHEVAIAGSSLARRARTGSLRNAGALAMDGIAAVIVGKIDLQRAADDRLDALLAEGLGEFERAEEVAGIGDGERRHAQSSAQGPPSA